MIGQSLIKTNFQFINYADALVHRLEEIGFERPITAPMRNQTQS
jgi:hypothetical protein